MEKNIRLRNMTAMYIQQSGQMLMLYRIGSRVVEPSWCGIGGHFEKEELNDPRSCALRELEEEAGIREEDLENLTLRYVTLRLKKGEIRQNYYFFADLKPGVQVSMISDEGRLKWIPQTELPSLKMPLTAKYMLEHYLQVGRFDQKIYSGTTTETGMAFTELKEF